ncbi:MAG: formylglycine-generating enzyme family protein [Verrucomicrobiales bacterium]|nr:formylglycine-generating enzyme family protein [Verrucomicrobiales bacterium]
MCVKSETITVLATSLLLGSCHVLAGTDIEPTASLVPPDQVHLSWSSVPGRTYQVVSTTDLALSWVIHPTAPPVLIASGSELSVNLPTADEQRFFRVVELPGGLQPLGNMVWIPPGTFVMGSPGGESGRYDDEGPQMEVTLTQGFWLGRCEVTQREYLELRGVNPSAFVGDLECPVEQVTWHDAVAYCAALTERERLAGRLPAGYAYRLPTEAEWEYACRAETTTRFYFGDALGCSNDRNCIFCAEMDSWMVWCGNYSGRPQPVGSRLPNAWGLYDMHGNVREWCADRYGVYAGGSVTDPEGPASGSARVCRGGSYDNYARGCRSAFRFPDPPESARSSQGLRVALSQDVP